MIGRFVFVLSLIMVGVAWMVSAQSTPPAHTQSSPPPKQAPIDPLVAIADADPLELARVTQRLGDAAVITRMQEANGTEVRLAAIRATPYLREPERALQSLATTMTIRDTLLAHAAAQSLLVIVRALDVDQLQRREVSPTELTPVRVTLERAAAIEHLRPDLRAIAAAASAMLVGLGVPLASG